MFGIIREKIIGVVNNAQKIEEAYRTARSSFSGFPAAVVTPSSNEAAYNTTASESNKETYIFTVRLYYPFTDGQDTADIALEQAIDEPIDTFRQRDVLAIGNAWVEPVPSIWGYQTTSQGDMRIAELSIRVKVYVENGE